MHECPNCGELMDHKRVYYYECSHCGENYIFDPINGGTTRGRRKKIEQ